MVEKDWCLLHIVANLAGDTLQTVFPLEQYGRLSEKCSTMHLSIEDVHISDMSGDKMYIPI